MQRLTLELARSRIRDLHRLAGLRPGAGPGNRSRAGRLRRVALVLLRAGLLPRCRA